MVDPLFSLLNHIALHFRAFSLVAAQARFTHAHSLMISHSKRWFALGTAFTTSSGWDQLPLWCITVAVLVYSMGATVVLILL